MERSTVTRSIGFLHRLHLDNQLVLQPEFQRNSVWPNKARAYFIDTILTDRPIPLLFFQRSRSPQSGKLTYYVVDGQQRLRAIMDYLADDFSLLESAGRLRNKFFSELREEDKRKIHSYELTIQELYDYPEKEIRDIFKRMNKYVVSANAQEVRHATKPGKFHDFIEDLAKLEFWTTHKIFTKAQRKRMRPQELCAELAILLMEGPQDKKASVDLYYDEHTDKFLNARIVRKTLTDCLDWIGEYIPAVKDTFLRKPAAFYALIGALRESKQRTKKFPRIVRSLLENRIRDFEEDMKSRTPSPMVSAYIEASSRQTDNIRPRKARIEILGKLITGKF